MLPGVALAAGLCLAPFHFCGAQELPASAEQKASAKPAGDATEASSGKEAAPSPVSKLVPPAPDGGASTTTAGSTQSASNKANHASFLTRPQPEPVIPQPRSFVADVPHLRDLEMAVPSVEIWRNQSTSPQLPRRGHRRFELGYVVGKEPTLVRLRFHPLAAGQAVVVQPGPGVTIDPADTEFRVEKNGECVVSVTLDGSFVRSDFNVYCAGVKTKVPLERATVDIVKGKEAAGRGGP